jgi:hypothetical protein
MKREEMKEIFKRDSGMPYDGSKMKLSKIPEQVATTVRGIFHKKSPDSKKEKNDKVPTSFTQLPDGSLVEMLYDPNRKPKTFFAKWKNGQITYHDQIEAEDGLVIVPYRNNQIVETKAILFPSKVEPYSDEKTLLDDIQNFVRKYVAISEFYERLVCYYILFSWIYDCFNVLPYLRVLGDYGTGKSRFLQVIGSLCYRPIFCSGAATTSPIFRLIEKFKGTLIVDEGDFRDSDEHARLIKIFNQGYMKGFPVIINEPIGNRYEPRSYDVYSPKILATRNEFKDKALESRCITEIMDGNLRDDIPIILPNSFWEEALSLRNKLLMWRFENWKPREVDLSLTDRTIEPRLAQVTLPLLSVIADETLKHEFRQFVRDFNRRTILERGESLEAEVLCAVCQLFDQAIDKDAITMKAIAEKVNEEREDGEQIKPRKVGHIVGKKLKLDKDGGKKGHYVMLTEKNQETLKRLKRRYGVDNEETLPIPQQRSQCPQRSPEEANLLSLTEKEL